MRTPLGDVTTYDRDAAGRPSSVTLPWGAQRTYTYADADANPESVTLPQGTTLSFTYDAAKRETSRTSSLGESRGFTYGPGDRIETMTDATGTTRYEYDSAGRFAGIVYPHGGSVRYVRDALGRTVRQEVRATASASPLVTTYDYDEVGNLTLVVDPQEGRTTFVYDAENRLERRTLPNGVVTTYTYDDRDRPLSVVHRNAANVVLASRSYARKPGGEPERITKEDGSYVLIGYDGALRITSEKYYGADDQLEQELGYTYDADGNRATKTVDGVVSTYHYASGGRLTGITTGGVTVGRTTDNGGRETSVVVDGHQLSLTYDSDDHVTRIADGASAAEFTFDAAGRRVGASTGGVGMHLLTGPAAGTTSSPHAFVKMSGDVAASFVYAGDAPLAKTTDQGTQYYLTDATGSVIATSDDAGTLSSIVDCDAFGNERQSQPMPSDTQGDFRLHGMWKDATGLYFVRARTYDAITGRFTSRDSAVGRARAPETLYPYAFSNSNPLVWSDPSGRSIVTVSVQVSIAFNLAATAISNYSAWSKGRLTTVKFGLLLGTAAVAGFAGGLTGGNTVMQAAMYGGAVNAITSAAQSALSQFIVNGDVQYLSVALSGIAGGFLGTLGGAISKGFAREGELIEHSEGLFTFAEDPKAIREWLAPLLSQSDIVFNNVLDTAVGMIANVLYSLSDDHTPPPRPSK